MAKRNNYFKIGEPLRHSHRPVSRRDFIAQGFRAGTATVVGASLMNFMTPEAHAISQDAYDLLGSYSGCALNVAGGQKIPFICFDLAGGANIAGSNVLVGQQGGQLDFLSQAGYSKLGLQEDIVPNNGQTNVVDTSLGLAFHSDSAMLRGINTSLKSGLTQTNVNGAVIPARSDNDTSNNPHNPLYGIYLAGARGGLLNLIGSQNTESGGNSMAPVIMIDPENRPTKIDRTSDVTGLVDVGDLSSVLTESSDVVSVMESISSITKFKLDSVQTGLSNSLDAERKGRFLCEYLKAAETYQNFSDPTSLDPEQDPRLFHETDSTAIFTRADFNSNRAYEKTAAVLKLVIDGNAGAGSITLGGYDYHTGDRQTGEDRDEVAGRCIGACLEYAQLVGKPVMIYVFSDGSVSSNGMIDPAVGKPQWTSDNSSTAASYFLVYNPAGQPQLNTNIIADPFRHQQIGWMRSDASVETGGTPAANSVNQLVNTVMLNYMALHDDISGFESLFSNLGMNHGLGVASNLEQYVAFNPIA